MNANKVTDYKTKSFIIILNSMKNIIASILLFLICLPIFIKSTDILTKIFILPFFICGNAILIKGLLTIFQGLKMLKTKENINKDIKLKIKEINKITIKLYTIGFFIFWFGFLIVFDYVAIKDWQNNGSYLFYFSFVFWIVGIVMCRKKFKK